jgi:hypothetical protein|tara:strand:- start:373 stop:696 length:324 start_codon:yes stop_codon:yes gene_type:complete
MRATDIIRSVLDLLDKVDEPQQEKTPAQLTVATDIPPEEGEPVASRFKSIYAMLSNRDQGEYSNTPNEVVADVDAVTVDAGGGVNGPKHPHDIRVKDPSMHPNQQEY